MVWQKVETVLNKKANRGGLRIISLNLMKYAAIFLCFVFFYLMDQFAKPIRKTTANAANFTTEPFDLQDISIYCNPNICRFEEPTEIKQPMILIWISIPLETLRKCIKLA